jgi:hypothetical protein
MSDTEKPESLLCCEEEEFSKSARKKARKMNCMELLDKINELTDKEKRGWELGTKGLKQRFRDYIGDDLTHGPSIKDQQRSSRTYQDEFIKKGCGDPPPEAKQLANAPLPLPAPASERAKQTAEGAAKVGIGVGGAYLTYRIIRFLPSLFPALWPTIPENLAIP